MKRVLIWGWMVVGILGCSSGAGSGHAELRLLVEEPQALSELHPHSIYHVLIETSDGAEVLVPATVPMLESESAEGVRYILPIEGKIQVPEVVVVFRYVAESSAESGTPLILGEARAEIAWSSHAEVAFDAASFDLESDVDEDGLSNLDEVELGLNPESSDTDGDGVSDAEDAFPDLSGEL